MFTIARMENDLFVAGKPSDQRMFARRLDEIVTDSLSQALERVAEDFTGEDGPVYRIRQLDLRLWLDTAALNDVQIAEGWAMKLSRALHRQIAEGASSQVMQYPSQAVFLATWLTDLLGHIAGDKWQYDEFSDLHDLPVGQAASLGLMRHPNWIGTAIRALGTDARRDTFVASFSHRDVLNLWHVWVGDPPNLAKTAPPTLSRQALSTIRQRPAFEGGDDDARARMGLKWLIALTLDGKGNGRLNPQISARLAVQLVHLGAMLMAVPDLSRLLASDKVSHKLLDKLLASLPADLERSAKWLRQFALAPDSAPARHALLELAQGPQANPRAATVLQVNKDSKIVSSFAGLSLLLPALQNTMLAAQLGPAHRVAILAHSQLAAARVLARSDTGLRWFCGYDEDAILDDSLDQGGWPAPENIILSEVDLLAYHDSVQTRLLRQLLDHFSADLRGMQGASIGYLAQQFLTRPGTIWRNDKHMHVRIQAIPLRVLLNMSGRLGEQIAIPWLKGRSLTIEVGDG